MAAVFGRRWAPRSVGGVGTVAAPLGAAARSAAWWAGEGEMRESIVTGLARKQSPKAGKMIQKSTKVLHVPVVVLSKSLSSPPLHQTASVWLTPLPHP